MTFSYVTFIHLLSLCQRCTGKWQRFLEKVMQLLSPFVFSRGKLYAFVKWLGEVYFTFFVFRTRIPASLRCCETCSSRARTAGMVGKKKPTKNGEVKRKTVINYKVAKFERLWRKGSVEGGDKPSPTPETISVSCVFNADLRNRWRSSKFLHAKENHGFTILLSESGYWCESPDCKKVWSKLHKLVDIILHNRTEDPDP